jgi:hypothetical protein
MSTNCRIIDKIESKKNVRTGGIMRESKEARYLPGSRKCSLNVG